MGLFSSLLEEHPQAKHNLNGVEAENHQADDVIRIAIGGYRTLDLPRNDNRNNDQENDQEADEKVVRIFEDISRVQENERTTYQESDAAQGGDDRPRFSVSFDHGKGKRCVRHTRTPDRHPE